MNITYKINKPADRVFGFLTNMSKFAAVHPVINKMDYLGENRYLVFETLPLGVIPFSFTYPATIKIYYEVKKVVIIATVMKINTIEMVFDIKEVAGFAMVEEVITFQTKLPIRAILRRIFKKQHAQLFKNIEDSIG